LCKKLLRLLHVTEIYARIITYSPYISINIYTNDPRSAPPVWANNSYIHASKIKYCLPSDQIYLTLYCFDGWDFCSIDVTPELLSL
jgi:hypothetical protein